MSVYSIILVLLIVGSFFFDNKKTSGLLFFFGMIFLIAVITGLRSENVGHDTANYIFIYENVKSLAFTNVFTTPPYNVLEPGYLLLSWLCGNIGLSPYIFILITSLFCIVSIGIWIWQNSKTPMFSLLIFFCMFYTFFLTGLRQSIALSIVLLSYKAINKSRWKMFIAFIILGFLFHRTALVFGLMFLISKVKNANNMLLLSLLAFPVIYTVRASVFPILTLVSDRFENYEILNHGDATNYTILLAIVCIAACICSLSKTHILDEYRRNQVCLMVSFLIMPFVGLNGSIMRVAMYFTMAICFLIPQAIEMLSNNVAIFVSKVFTIFILMFLVSATLLSSEIYKYEFNSFLIL